MTEGIEILNLKEIRILKEKETYKHMSILEADTIKQAGMKKNIKQYLKRMRKLLDNCINLIKRINTLAVPLVRYSGP